MKKWLVGVIHLPPLPGAPRSSLSLREIVKSALGDLEALVASGFDGVIVENFGDAPFFRDEVPKITLASMSIVAAALRERAPTFSLGINVLRNDAASALAVAAAAGANFIRVNVHTGARVTDQGIVEGRAFETARLRKELVPGLKIWADIDVKHSSPLAPRSLEEEAEETVGRGLADVLLVTGSGTGKGANMDDVSRVKRVEPNTRVLVASGATLANLSQVLGVSDGVIVGSALRKDGKAGGSIDPSACAAYAKAFALA